MSDLKLNITQKIKAGVEKVFDAWLNPETLAKFMLPGGDMVTRVTKLEPVVGGGFEIIMACGSEPITHTGVYKEIERTDKLVFTWISPFTVDDSTVSLTFSALSENETEVSLEHVKFPNAETRDNHLNGWGRILNSLQLYFEKN